MMMLELKGEYHLRSLHAEPAPSLSNIVPPSFVCSGDEEGHMKMSQFLYIQKCHHHCDPFGGESMCSKLCSD